jgi:hypothetical protein
MSTTGIPSNKPQRKEGSEHILLRIIVNVDTITCIEKNNLNIIITTATMCFLRSHAYFLSYLKIQRLSQGKKSPHKLFSLFGNEEKTRKTFGCFCCFRMRLSSIYAFRMMRIKTNNNILLQKIYVTLDSKDMFKKMTLLLFLYE